MSRGAVPWLVIIQQKAAPSYVDTPNLPYARRHTVEAQQLERSYRSELPYYGWETTRMTATITLPSYKNINYDVLSAFQQC